MNKDFKLLISWNTNHISSTEKKIGKETFKEISRLIQTREPPSGYGSVTFCIHCNLIAEQILLLCYVAMFSNIGQQQFMHHPLGYGTHLTDSLQTSGL